MSNLQPPVDGEYPEMQELNLNVDEIEKLRNDADVLDGEMVGHVLMRHLPRRFQMPHH